MDGLQMIEQKTVTDRAKGVGHWIFSNLLPLLAVLIPSLMFMSAFFDIKIVGGVRILQNGLFMVAEILIGERVTLLQGSKNGKLDKELLKTVDKYHDTVENVIAKGITLLPEFCRKETREEFPKAKEEMIHSCGLSDEEYDEKYSKMSYMKLAVRFGFERAGEIYRIRKLKPIVISESMLLCENLGHYRRREITASGDEIVSKKSFSIGSLLTGTLTAVFFASILPVFKNGVTPSDIGYVAIVLVCLLWRMAMGYYRGYRAQAVGQKRSLESKIIFLNRYLEFLDGKEGN